MEYYVDVIIAKQKREKTRWAIFFYFFRLLYYVLGVISFFLKFWYAFFGVFISRFMRVFH